MYKLQRILLAPMFAGYAFLNDAVRCVAEYGLYHVGLPRETMISNSDIRFACGTCERCGFYTA